jgi:CheY-like chemotaxis protein
LGTIEVIMAKILLVEDDKSLREIYGVRLIAEGYEIVSAGDGEEALAMAIKEKPDLIVSDVMMPKISGFDMLDILRSTTETKSVKVIMMTALSSDDQRARGEALGADRYLVKSQVGIEDVVRTVHDVLGDGVPGSVPAGSTSVFNSPAPAPTTPATSFPAPSVPVSTPPVQAEPAFTPPASITPDLSAMPAPTPPLSEPPVINMPTPTPVAPTEPTPAPFALPTPPSEITTAAPIIAPVTPTVLPEPTAPFSSPRPASLGDRIINPLTPAESASADISSMMNQELSSAGAPTSPPPAQATPPLPPTPPVPPVAPQV